MIDLKAGYHNIPFQASHPTTQHFTTHRGKYHWLRMPMGLMQAPTHFQFIVESVLKGKPGNCALPVVVYLDDIADFGDEIRRRC